MIPVVNNYRNIDVMVFPEHVRPVMESYSAADVSAETNEPVTLPLSNHSLSILHDMNHAIEGESS